MSSLSHIVERSLLTSSSPEMKGTPATGGYASTFFVERLLLRRGGFVLA